MISPPVSQSLAQQGQDTKASLGSQGLAVPAQITITLSERGPSLTDERGLLCPKRGETCPETRCQPLVEQAAC